MMVTMLFIGFISIRQNAQQTIAETVPENKKKQPQGNSLRLIILLMDGMDQSTCLLTSISASHQKWLLSPQNPCFSAMKYAASCTIV